jgi:hypothetical protein
MSSTPLITVGDLQARGYSLIPCKPNKKPFLPTWKAYQGSAATAEQLAEWGEKKRPSAWAIVTGRVSGIITLDFDGTAGAETMQKLRVEPHRRTPSGGYHADFAHPGFPVQTLNHKSKRELGARWPGLDIRADGGYVLALGRNSTGEYAWLRDPAPHPLESLPADLREFLGLLVKPSETAKVHTAPSPISNSNGSHGVVVERILERAIREAAGQGRNNAGFWLACQLRDNAISESEAAYWIRRYAAAMPGKNMKGQPEPYTEHEAMASVREAYKHAPREPWGFGVSNSARAAGMTSDPADTVDSQSQPHPDLDQVIAVFKKWLYLPDPAPLVLNLAFYAANRMEGDPVWLLNVGPPSSGKTELIYPLCSLPDFYPAATITEAGLLSGTPKRESAKGASGGLLRSVGNFGYVGLKDFTSVLSMNRDARSAMLAALREVYDGAWTRHVGTDGGKCLSWQGKCALIAGCTPVIDQHHAVMASMGERFLLFRLPELNADELAFRALSNPGKEKSMRTELAGAVASFFSALQIPETPPQLTATERDLLMALSTLVVRCRSSVERDPYTREIDLVPDAEAPGRLARALSQLLRGLKVIGAPTELCLRIIHKVGLDCIPAVRRAALEYLFQHSGTESTTTIAAGIRYPTTTARRALEELAAHRVLDRLPQGHGKADLWTVSDWCSERLETANQAFPKCSDSQT